MRRLRIRRDPAKGVLTALAERIAAETQGRLTTYSPLSRFEELDSSSWASRQETTLDNLAGLKTRLPDIDFAQLIDRAAQQRALLEPRRAQAGIDAFRQNPE